MNLLKKSAIILMAAAMASVNSYGYIPIQNVTQSVFTANAADIVNSGKCGAEGDNLQWTLDSEGTLTISGEGKMTDWMFGTNDWNGISAIKKVVIEKGVTSIGYNAFADCEGITEVVLPDSITEIGAYAFSCCMGLTKLSIPEGVTSIGANAFVDCENLNEIMIPESITNIGAAAFTGTPWFNAMLDENPLVIVSDIVVDGMLCKGDIVIPDNVTAISPLAFLSAADMTSVTIPDSVQAIGEGAFSSCDNITSIVIPKGVTTIEENTFEGCESLYSVTLPNTVTKIEDWAFSYCESITLFTIPESVTEIGEKAFVNCSSLATITIPESVKSIGELAFGGCTALTAAVFENENCGIFDDAETIPDTAIIYGYTGSTAEAYAKKYNREFMSLGEIPLGKVVWELPTVTVDSNDELIKIPVILNKSDERKLPVSKLKFFIDYDSSNIGLYSITGESEAYDGEIFINSAIGQVSITNSSKNGFEGENLSEIIEFEFRILDGCPKGKYPIKIKELYVYDADGNDITDNITVIDGSINYGLQPVSTTTTTQTTAATTTTSAPQDKPITTTTKPAVTIVSSGECGAEGDNVKWTLDSDGTLTISGEGEMYTLYFGVPELGRDENGVLPVEIERVVIENGVTSISGTAFNGFSTIKEVDVAESVKSIGKFAFFECNMLESILLPVEVESIGLCAFAGCNSLASISIENPKCIIGDDEDTIPQLTVIHGYTGSTAEAYSKKYEREFISLDEKPAETKLGDVNGDASVNSSDASAILAEYAGIQTGGAGEFTASQRLAADVNKDGVIDSSDASKILAYYADSATGQIPSWD